MAKTQTGIIQYKDLVMQKIKSHYQSIILGILVLLVAVSVIARLSTSQKNNTDQSKKDTQNTVEESATSEGIKSNSKEYTVKKGENLWMIAQKNYGSGYNAVDIAKVNKLKNPNIIEIGMKLILPEVKANTPTTGIIAEAQTGKVTISEKEYKIKVGEKIWKIAVRAYGDGYQWMKIAQANKLTNPDVIHKDNILSLPR